MNCSVNCRERSTASDSSVPCPPEPTLTPASEARPPSEPSAEPSAPLRPARSSPPGISTTAERYTGVIWNAAVANAAPASTTQAITHQRPAHTRASSASRLMKPSELAGMTVAFTSMTT
jgi:hypothetical protein